MKQLADRTLFGAGGVSSPGATSTNGKVTSGYGGAGGGGVDPDAVVPLGCGAVRGVFRPRKRSPASFKVPEGVTSVSILKIYDGHVDLELFNEAGRSVMQLTVDLD